VGLNEQRVDSGVRLPDGVAIERHVETIDAWAVVDRDGLIRDIRLGKGELH
jgi:hypothetical protein